MTRERRSRKTSTAFAGSRPAAVVSSTSSANDDGEVLSPRELAANDGLLAWEARFPARRVKEFEYELGQYAFAGQYQQSPTPRKGGIFKREYWQPYVPPTTGSRKGMWPDFDFIVVSVDSAFTEKEETIPPAARPGASGSILPTATRRSC
jgi:hypothetical protein